MQLLTILLSLAFMHLWGGRNPLQRDDWYWKWLDLLGAQESLMDKPMPQLLLAVGAPAVVLLLLVAVVALFSYWLLLPLGVAVLLYSFGREPMDDIVQTYASACACDDWDFGGRQAALLGVDATAVEQGDWSSLHHKVLEAAAYRGFERVFAVIFWFVLLGPLGAFLYRLSRLYQGSGKAPPAAERWLWLLEWPAVRVLGLSFAVTGNFVGCFRRWQACFLCTTRSSQTVLTDAVTGALAVDEDLQVSPCVTRRELVALDGLYRRTDWFWLAVLGVWAILY